MHRHPRYLGARSRLGAAGATLLALPLLVAPNLHAQQADADTTAKPVGTDDDIVVLSPFSVTADQDVGYVANNTLAGSRLRTNLSEIPNAVSVFTQEFMSDLNATSESDLMRYSAAAVPETTDQTPAAQGISIDTGGFQFRIRGQLATRTRNYFGSVLVPDTFNSERFEEARGPNAILFGLGGAGGILNTTTKQAVFGRDITNLAFVVGSDNQLRGTIDFNRRLGSKFAVRLNAVTETADGWHPYDFRDNQRIHFTATYRPWRNTSIRFEGEYGDVSNTLTRNYAPFDNVSLWKLSGSPTVASGIGAGNAALGYVKRNANKRVTYIGNDASFQNFQQTVFSQQPGTDNRHVLLPSDWAEFDDPATYPQEGSFSGPGGISEFNQYLAGAVIESEPVKNLFIELAAVHERRQQDVYDTTNEVYRIYGEPGATFRDGTTNPYVGDYYVDTRWVLRHEKIEAEHFRATISYQKDFGIFGRHTLSAAATRDNTYDPRYVAFLVLAGAPYSTQPQNAVNQIWTRQYIENPADLRQWAVPDFRLIPDSFSVVMDSGVAATTFSPAWANNELNDQWQHLAERMVTLQSAFWRNRIITTVGYRYTKRDAYSRPTNADLTSGPLSFTTSPLQFLDQPLVVDSYDLERISYGVVGKATSWLSGYYNYSENAQIPGTTQTLIPDSSPFPLNAGEGEDYGVMMNLLDSRVFVRFGYFTTNSVDQASAFGVNNVSVRNDRILDAMQAAGIPSATGAPRATGGDFDLADLATHGYELNLTANLTNSWRLMINASKSESVQTNMLKRSRAFAALVLPIWNDPAAQALVTSANVTVAQEIANYDAWLQSTTAVEGESTIGHRELQVRAFTRYDFKHGFLRGFYAGGGFRYGSAPPVGRSTAGDIITSPVSREADALVGYRRSMKGKFGLKSLEVQFNANNLLQQEDFTYMRVDADGQIFRAQVNAPTRYSLTTRLSF